MKKIAIIGCGGSGKSTLAVELGRRLGLPVHHLDRMYWKPNWTPSETGEFVAAQYEVVDRDAWIIDGNYSATMEIRLANADTVIFLDLPTWTCLLGALTRYVRYRHGTRPDMGEGNAERLDKDFFKWILTYRRTRRPRVLERLDSVAAGTGIVTLTSRREIARFLADVGNVDPARATK